MIEPGMIGYTESVLLGDDSPWMIEAEAMCSSNYPHVEIRIRRRQGSSSFHKTVWNFTSRAGSETLETVIDVVLGAAKTLEIPIEDGDRANAMAAMLRVRHQAVRTWVRYKAKNLLPFFGPEDAMEAWALAVGDAVIDS